MSIASYRLYVMSYLCVRLSTVSTDVGFHMLGVPVLGDVLQQGGLVSETLVAGVALVGLVALVAARVGLQVGQLGEGLRAAWVKNGKKTTSARQEISYRQESCPDFFRPAAVNCFCAIG